MNKCVHEFSNQFYVEAMLKLKYFKSKLTPYFEDQYLCLLIVIIFIGFLLRLWGIWNIEQTDEFNEVFEALKVDSGRLNFDRWNKKVLIYILAIEYGIYFCIGWLIGIFNSVSDFTSKIVINMQPLFIIGRATSAIFGTTIVFITYKIGGLLFNKKVGVLAALFLCFNFVHVEHSHLCVVDITMTLVVVCSFFFAIKMAYSGSRKSYFLAGLFAGLAIVAKIPSVFILLSLVTAHLIYCYEEGKPIVQLKTHQNIIILLVGILLGNILGSPGILFAPISYFKYLLSLLGAYEGTADKIPYFTAGNGYLFYLESMAKNMGLPIFLCFLFSMSFVRSYWKKYLLLFSFSIPFYLFVSNSKWFVADRYMIPIYPFLSVLAAIYIVEVLDRFKKEWLMASVGVVLIMLPALKIIPFELSLTKQNSRYNAKEWIEKNIHRGSKILIDSGRTINTYSPPIFPNAENLKRMICKIENLKEGETYDDSRIADARSVIYYKYLLVSLPEITYDITSTERGEAVHRYSYYEKNGYDFIVTSDLITWRTKTLAWRKIFVEQAKFYDHLENMDPIKVFRPGRLRAGPTIKIFKVSK